eukprot:7387337-Prymnesium_polylepis.1
MQSKRHLGEDDGNHAITKSRKSRHAIMQSCNHEESTTLEKTMAARTTSCALCCSRVSTVAKSCRESQSSRHA